MACAEAAAELLRVELVYCPAPGVADRVSMTLACGTTLGAALVASGLLARHCISADGLHTGIWGKACDVGTVLQDRDRVEIYRGLKIDPKEARRLRARQSRGSAAGR